MSHPPNIMIAPLDSSELVKLLISTNIIGESRKGDRPLKNDQDVCLYFTEEQFSFLMHIAGQYADGDDNSLTEEAVLRALVRLLQQMKVDMTGVKTEDEMLQRLEDAIETEIVRELVLE
jgi:GAF domain-containing protein